MQIIYYRTFLIVLFLSLCGQIKTAAPGERHNGFWPNPEPALTLMRRDEVPRILSQKIRLSVRKEKKSGPELADRSQEGVGLQAAAEDARAELLALALADNDDGPPPSIMFSDEPDDPPPAYPEDKDE